MSAPSSPWPAQAHTAAGMRLHGEPLPGRRAATCPEIPAGYTTAPFRLHHWDLQGTPLGPAGYTAGPSRVHRWALMLRAQEASLLTRAAHCYTGSLSSRVGTLRLPPAGFRVQGLGCWALVSGCQPTNGCRPGRFCGAAVDRRGPSCLAWPACQGWPCSECSTCWGSCPPASCGRLSWTGLPAPPAVPAHSEPQLAEALLPSLSRNDQQAGCAGVPSQKARHPTRRACRQQLQQVGRRPQEHGNKRIASRGHTSRSPDRCTPASHACPLP